jgi:mannose-6-phosphate isomerase-like protein (cupin superfamily)
MAITITDMRGRGLTGVHVDVMGPTPRMGESDLTGQANFPGLQSGTYRIRFSSDAVTAFEREVTLRAGAVETFDVALSPAPPPKEVPVPAVSPAAPASAAGAATGPAGQVQSFSIVDTLEKDFVGKQPRRESLLSCSGNLRTTMIQLNDTQPERLYSNAEAMYYVLGGEGTARLNGRDIKLVTNGFVSVPRGTTHSFRKAGSRALVLLAVLSGEPCESAR